MVTLNELDKRKLRTVLGAFTTGVTVITTTDDQGQGHGLTANSFSSVSLDPPLVLWSQARTSKSFDVFQKSDHFAINILADDQIAVSNHFAKSGDDKFANVSHAPGLGGVPVIDGVCAHLECEKYAAYPGGDHVIYLGLVKRMGFSARRPLVFGSGKYMVAYVHDLGPVSLQLSDAPTARPEEIKFVQDALPEVVARVGQHCICLVVWGNHGPTAIHWQPSVTPISENLRVGLVFNITSTAAGKVFAAFAPGDLARQLIEEDLRLFRRPDEDAEAQATAFACEMEAVRQYGMSTTVDPDPARRLHGVATNAFGVPIFNRNGQIVMALAMLDRVDSLPPDRSGADARALLSVSRELSEGLGWRPSRNQDIG